MKTRFSVLGAKTVCIALLCVPMMSCGILGFGADVPVSCTDGQRTCADLNESNPTGDACTFWACVDESRCEVVPKDTDRDGVLDNGCEPQGSPQDCDENDNRRFPGNPEVCDYVDNDCNGDVDEGFAYGVTETNVWPFGSIPKLPDDPDADNKHEYVHFATKSSADGLILAATFDYGTSQNSQAGIAVWSDVSTLPSPFAVLKNILAASSGDVDPVVDDPTHWLVLPKYTSLRPFIAEDSIGVVASAEKNGDSYFAARVSQANQILQARIHRAFDPPTTNGWNPIGQQTKFPSSAATNHGLLIVATKQSCDSNCTGGGTNNDIFVQLLVPAEVNAWAPSEWDEENLEDFPDQCRIGSVSDAELPATIVGLPSNNWLTAHVQSSGVELSFIRREDLPVNCTTITPYQYEVTLTGTADQLALAVGPQQGNTTIIALSYVQDNRAIFKLLELTEEPAPVIIERASVQAPKGDAAHTHPMAVYHPPLDEWLLSWHEATSPERFAFVRMTTSGTLIENTLTHGLNKEGRELPYGMGLAYRDQGYAFVSYAEDSEDPRFVTGGIGCPSGN